MPDIYFSSLDRKEKYKLPILPPEMPELSRGAKNEEFETFDNGIYNLPGNVGLATFSIDCWLPEYPGKYTWAKSQVNPYLIINLWSGAMAKQLPVRCIMERGKSKNNISPVILNWLVTVENMSWHEDTVGDVKYKIDFKEYRSLIDFSDGLNKAVEASKNAIMNSMNIFK